MAEVFASNMAYRPRSQPNFPGDLHHDIRDHMIDCRAETLSIWAGKAIDRYLAACRLVDIRDDPVADSLETFNSFELATLSVAHDHLAAHWRCVHLPAFLADRTSLFPSIPGASPQGIRNSLGVCLCAFRHWLTLMVDFDATHAPIVIRRICLVLVQQNTAQGIMAEIDLFDTLRQHYPLPPRNAAQPPS